MEHRSPGSTTIGIAIDIPPPWGELLTARRAAAGDPAAEHEPAHLTLIGPTEVDAAALPGISRHLADVARQHGPFPLHLRGTGTFRPLTEVVFVCVAAGIGECERIHEALRSSPAIRRELAFPYHPHVTVAHKVDPAAMDAVFDDLAAFEAEFTVTGFTLFEHGPGGRWHPQQEYVLRGDQRR
ncbi:MAG TPA: 2'-5' RNA ligase family protein [Micromonosporaceae bacterium]|nr:2'-5' RNA ligase family protein [Micromonosporaceae bacterium]